MKSKPSISLYIDRRKSSKIGLYPLKMIIIYNRIQRMYSLGLQVSLADYEKLNSHRLKNKNLLIIREACHQAIEKAKTIIDSMEEFSFDGFKSLFFDLDPATNPKNSPIIKDLAWFYLFYISELKLSGRVSTYQSINNSYQSLSKFKQGIDFIDINPRFLENYENWMLGNGNSITTVGIYIRSLRVILNLAIEENVFSPASYPFGKRKYVIPTGRNIKKALSTAELKMIFEFKPIISSQMDKARDFWIFSYLCLGLNLADIARIRIKDISNEKITLIREKTKGSKRGNSQSLEIFLHPMAQEILNKWGLPYGSTEDYVFDILKISFSPEQVRSALQNFNKLINKNMAKIGKELGILKSLNFYSGRHSSATMLFRKGVSIDSISMGLGHQDTKITMAYINSFEDNKKKELTKILTDF